MIIHFLWIYFMESNKLKNISKIAVKLFIFNLYNMIELPIYQMAKQYKNKTLELNQILNEFKAEKKYEIKCNKCKK